MIIYKTTNLLNGKIYVGKDSKNNPNYLGSGIYIYKSIKKHGKENFKKEIICECCSKEELNKKEKYWIKTLNSKIPNGYNISDGGDGGDNFTFNPNRENIRKKQSVIKKGKLHSEEHNRKIGLSQIGKTISKEQCIKHSEFMIKNNPMKNPDTVKKMMQSNAGFKHSEYSKSLIAEKKIGKNNPMFGVSPWNKKEPIPSQLCLCGCGEMTKQNMKYIYGHNRRGKKKHQPDNFNLLKKD